MGRTMPKSQTYTERQAHTNHTHTRCLSFGKFFYQTTKKKIAKCSLTFDTITHRHRDTAQSMVYFPTSKTIQMKIKNGVKESTSSKKQITRKQL